MDHQTLLMLAGEQYPVGDLAAAILGGEDVYFALWDAIQESNLNMESPVLVGHRYLFKTLAHYYEGVVTKASVGWCEIRDVSIIYSLGESDKVLDTRKWRRSEKYRNMDRRETMIFGTITGITYLGDE